MHDRHVELQRDLGLWAAVAIVVGTVIGSGIFLVPRAMVLRVGSAEMVFVVWIFGGLLSLAGALSYAELAAAMPEAGGEYAYLREAYGPVVGLPLRLDADVGGQERLHRHPGHRIFLLLNHFLSRHWTGFFTPCRCRIGPGGGPLELRWGQLLAMALILLLALVNYFGVKIGGDVQVVVTAVKIALIVFIVVAGLMLGASGTLPPAAAGAPLTVAGFFAALVAALVGLRRLEQRQHGGERGAAARSATCRWP